MNRPRSIMSDIETMGVDKRPVILSIGLVAFDDDGFLNAYDKTRPEVFYGQVPWDDPSQSQRTRSAATLAWWDQQHEAKRLLQAPAEWQRGWVKPDLTSLLTEAHAFIKSELTFAGRVMSKGIDFDLAILEQAFIEAGMDVPWPYQHTRCQRAWLEACTAFGLSPYLQHGMKNPGLKHHAADDAIWQTMIYVRYNHEIWKTRNKTAQQDLFAAPPALEPAP